MCTTLKTLLQNTQADDLTTNYANTLVQTFESGNLLKNKKIETDEVKDLMCLYTENIVSHTFSESGGKSDSASQTLLTCTVKT